MHCSRPMCAFALSASLSDSGPWTAWAASRSVAPDVARCSGWRCLCRQAASELYSGDRPWAGPSHSQLLRTPPSGAGSLHAWRRRPSLRGGPSYGRPPVWWRRRDGVGHGWRDPPGHSPFLSNLLCPHSLPSAASPCSVFPIPAISGKAFHLGLPLRYLLDLSIVVLTYMMLGSGLNIVVGLAGLLDLGYVAFYAVGAYSFAILAMDFGWSFWMSSSPACSLRCGLYRRPSGAEA